LPEELAKRNITLDNAKSLLRDKCIEAAGEMNGTVAYEAIEAGIADFGECITKLVNYTEIQQEITLASPKGELDTVFHKYCNKRPEALECADTLNSKFVPCLEKEERENQDIFMRIMRSLLEFVCHKGGDQIALFIAEKGPECLKSKEQDIQQCVNNTFSGYVPKEGMGSMNSLPKLVMDKKHCQDIEKLEVCIVTKLETCEEITPANIVESMFRFIKNETICRNNKKSNAAFHKTSSGATINTNSIILFTSFYCILNLFRKLLQSS
jgi:hypothetical protein